MNIIRELIQALRELTAEMRRLRESLEPQSQQGGGGGPPPVK